MSHTFIALSAVFVLLAFNGAARAQDLGPQPATLEITFNPVGATFWNEGTDDGGGPDFGQYHTALAATWNFNRHWGAEGEVAGDIGLEQRLDFASGSVGDVTPPSAVGYTGNLLYYPWRFLTQMYARFWNDLADHASASR